MLTKEDIEKCVECGSKNFRPIKKDLTFNRPGYGKIKVADQEGLECAKCGEIYFDEEQSARLDIEFDRICHAKRAQLSAFGSGKRMAVK